MLLWMIFALLTAGGLLALVWPLLRGSCGTTDRTAYDAEIYRDQLREVDRDLARGVLNAGDAEAARVEISRRLLAVAGRVDSLPAAAGATRQQRRMAALATVIVVPALSLALYLAWGSPTLDGQPLAERLAAPLESRDLPELIARVEAHLRENPSDTKGWRVVAPVYSRLGRFADAAAAYEQIMLIEGRSPEILSDYGEALTLAQGGLITRDARGAFAEAVRISPELAKPRYYLGLADFQDGQKEEAIARWRDLLADAPADAPWRATVEQRLVAATGDAAALPALTDDAVSAAGEMPPEQRQRMIEGMVDRLADRLNSEGGDLGDWLRLARAQTVLGRNAEAASTLERARAAFAGQAGQLDRIDRFATGLSLQ